MFRFFLKAIIVVGVLAIAISVIMIFGPDQKRPSGEVDEAEKPSGTADAQDNEEPKAQVAAVVHDMHNCW